MLTHSARWPCSGGGLSIRKEMTWLLFNVPFAVLLYSMSARVAFDGQHDDMQDPLYDGKPASYWKEKLQESDASSFIPSLSFPLRKNPDPKAIPVLLKLLADDDARVRESAACCIGLLRDRGGIAAQALSDVVQHDTKRSVRRKALIALGAIGPSATVASSALYSAQNDKEPVVRLEAARALWKVTGRADIAVQTLIQLSNVSQTLPDSEISRFLIHLVYREMGPDAGPAVPALIDDLSGSRGGRDMAAETLAAIGPPASAALPILRISLKDRDVAVQFFSARALLAIGGYDKDAFEVVIKVLKDCKFPVWWRERSIWSLEALGKESKDSLPVLQAVMKEGDQELRTEAAHAVERIQGCPSP
jgi:HEAT repeat protein